jgi:hypothetical protein
LLFRGEGDNSYNCFRRSPLQNKAQSPVTLKKRNCRQWSALLLYPPLDTIPSQFHTRPIFPEPVIAHLAQRRATCRSAGVRIPAGARNFSVLHSSKTGSGAYPTSYTMSIGDLPQGVKRLRHEADH